MNGLETNNYTRTCFISQHGYIMSNIQQLKAYSNFIVKRFVCGAVKRMLSQQNYAFAQ